MKVTIGISSLNEEKNIGKLLGLLERQRESEAIRICQIIVSDDSADKTPAIVQAFCKKDSRIELYHYSQRRGKPAAINEIFSKARGDVVVLFDADVLPANENVIVNLIKSIPIDYKIGITGGAAFALKPQTLVERIALFTFKVWCYIRENLRGGMNFFAIHGKIMAVSSKIFRVVRIPEGVIGDDAYLYLMCIKLGYKTIYVKDAAVYYRETRSLRDFLVRRIKYEKNLNQLISIFGDFAKKEVAIPRILLMKATLREGVHDPFGFFFSIPLVLWSKLIARIVSMNALWPIAFSTKEV